MTSSQSTPNVLVIGSLNMDLIAFAPRLPRPGETLLGTRWTRAHGGKGANQAIAAARLGARVAMLGRVGRDAYGTELRDALVAEGIDCSGVIVDCDNPSGAGFITVDDHGENCIVVIPGSNGALSGSDVDAHQEMVRRTRIVVCQLETPISTVSRALELASHARHLVILNPAPAPAASVLTPQLLSHVDLLLPNETEAALLTDLPVSGVAEAILAGRKLRSMGCREVIITLGALGVVHVSRDAEHHYPARPVEAIDATAAGDTFIGGLAAGLARGMDMPAAIGLGQAAARVCVSRIGAQSSIPTLEQLNDYH